MGLTHTIIKVRPYLGKWESLVNIEDSQTGRIYHEMFTTSSQPDADMLAPLITAAKVRIGAAIELADNDLNLTTDEDRLLGHYREVKTDIILRIRKYPNAKLPQASDYIAGKYPDSVFDFNNLYQIWLDITHCANWAEFKQFCINKRFEGID